MLKKILIGLAAIIVVFLVVVALQPTDFRITRSVAIAAPAETVFAQINDFHKWEGWSPWEKMDLTMKKTFEGPSEGVGAVYGWIGNDKVGEGRMTITESRPSELIAIKLEFMKPFAATNVTEFTLMSAGNQTEVKWSMVGKNNFMAKAFCLFMDMDKMVGGDFEKGLAALKSVAEAVVPIVPSQKAPRLPAPGKRS